MHGLDVMSHGVYLVLHSVWCKLSALSTLPICMMGQALCRYPEVMKQFTAILAKRFGSQITAWLQGAMNQSSAEADRCNVDTADMNMPCFCGPKTAQDAAKKMYVDPDFDAGISVRRIVDLLQQHIKKCPKAPTPTPWVIKIDGTDQRAALRDSRRGGQAALMPSSHIEFIGDHSTGGCFQDGHDTKEQEFRRLVELRDPLIHALDASVFDATAAQPASSSLFAE